jgi:Amiloride-sensitive sodium channel
MSSSNTCSVAAGDSVMLRILSLELRRFGESTSVRGIPRAIKSKDYQLVAMWIVAVAVCTGLLLWQITSVVVRYRKHDIVTTTSEADDYGVNPVLSTVSDIAMNPRSFYTQS